MSGQGVSDGPKVVMLRQGPSLQDVTGMLRKLAGDIERGEHGDVDSATVLIPRANDYPIVFGFGDMTGQRDPVITCEMAKAWMILNHVGRS